MKTIAYLRVSTTEQEIHKNKADILVLANDKNLGKVHFVEEVVSGKVSWKQRKIKNIIDELGEGDNLILSELSRLGRSMLECIEIISIASQNGTNIYTVKGNWQLDDTIQSKIIAMVFSMTAEIERDLISKRTKEALKARKAMGKSVGRPKGSFGKSKLDGKQEEIKKLLDKNVSKTSIAKIVDISRTALYHFIKTRNLK